VRELELTLYTQREEVLCWKYSYLQKDGPRKCLINIVFNSVLVSQYDRIKELNHELQEKAEAAELQISTISHEYRTMLQEKEVHSLDKVTASFSCIHLEFLQLFI
jgi:hypothetical protein